MSRRALWASCVLVPVFSLVGCNSHPSRVIPPAIDPAQAAQQALAEYDTNGDGQLDASELDKVPSIKNSLKEIDKNGDGKVSGDEIKERIEQWQASKVAIMPFNCRVTLDRAPLPGATVTVIPEKFLGPNVQTATGKTNEQGFAALSMPKDKMPNPNFSGVNVAFYKVKISKEAGGSETLPARYNENSELGQEVCQGLPALQSGVAFDLKSK